MNNHDVKLKIRKAVARKEADNPKLDAVDFVTKCKSIANTTELQNLLQGELGKLKLLLANQVEVDLIKNFVMTVRRGLHHTSKSMEAEQYYWYGYYVAQMQAVLDSSLQETTDNALFMAISARTAFAPIMHHLYEVGACQHKVLADVLHMNKSNLSKEMEKMVAVGLVNKIKGGKFVHYELTQQGYTLLNRYYQINHGFHTHNTPVQNQYITEVSRQILLALNRNPADNETRFDYSYYFFIQEELKRQLLVIEPVKEENDESQFLLEGGKNYCDFEDLSFERHHVERSVTYVQ